MMQELLIAFDAEIDRLPISIQVKDWLKNHERKEIALNGLAEQIKICEVRLGSFRFDLSKYKKVTEGFVKTFANLAIKNAEHIAVSVIERQRRIDEANKIERIKEEFEADVAEDSRDVIRSFGGMKKNESAD